LKLPELTWLFINVNQKMKRIIITRYILITFIIAIYWQTGFGQLTVPDSNTITAFTGARIYTSPLDPVMNNAVLIIKNEKIIAVGKTGVIKIPKNSIIINCKGLTITAGFWNSHVHFMDPKITTAANLDDDQLTGYLQNFLTRYGVTHVFDIGSFPENTISIRKRIESGKVDGPIILTTGFPFAPVNGTPFYIEPLKLPELSSPLEATEMVTKQLDNGADGIKIFAASPVMPGPHTVVMPVDIAKAVVAVAHGRGKPVFAHPTSNQGINVVLQSGVDLIAHTTPDAIEGWDSSVVKKMLAANLYVIPTLKLWKWELMRKKLAEEIIDQFVSLAISQVKSYFKAGGKILFGTDIGYMDDFDPLDEYEYLQKAGLGFRDILAVLTTAPAEKFGFAKQTGVIKTGMNADLVIFDGDPATDIKSLIRVKYTFRKGKIIYQSGLSAFPRVPQ
jgi:imidazolonepropionase-like amidohydrolase